MLLESGWLIEEEVKRIKIVLEELELVEIIDDQYFVSPRGLNILLYYKIRKIQGTYNKNIFKSSFK